MSAAELWDTLTGAELIRAIGEGKFPQVTDVSDYIGQVIVGAEPGRVELAWTPDVKLCNPGGTVHGGFIATILDNAVCLAASSLGDVFVPQLTLNLNIDYLRAVQAGETYRVIGTVTHAGRSRTVSAATLFDARDRACAAATASVTGNQIFARDRKSADGA
ncbi:PaaI family thioesterase [Actinocorallia populi]|uniref:PaaI family thioesterase n=1 Tax=Actinocorallia populi TaxID=2079200 RepID=UPI001E2AC475|nr:PaaI family thioesterase [Actinocorallia populi]